MIARSPRELRSGFSLALAGALVAIVAAAGALPGVRPVGAAATLRPAQQTPQEVCGAVVTSTVWSAAVGTYRATCSVRVQPGVTLTVESGVTVRFTENAALQVDGGLVVGGGSPGDVLLTSDKPEQARGDWPGVVVDREGRGVMRGLTVRYAGRGGNPAIQVRGRGLLMEQSLIQDTDAVAIRTDGSDVTLRDVTLERSTQHAIQARQSSDRQALVSLERVTFRDNQGDAVRSDANIRITQASITADGNKTNGIVVQSGQVNFPLVWQADELPIVPDGAVTANEGITVTAGSVIKSATTGSVTLRDGVFTVQGTESEPVVFTALTDDTACTVPSVDCDTNNDGGATTPDRGSWRYVDLFGASGASLIRHAEFRYAGGPALWVRAAGVTIANSVFSRSRDHGVRVENVSAVIADTEFVGNRSVDRGDAAGLYVDNTLATPITLTLSTSAFSDNDYAVHLKSPNITLLNEGNTTDYTNGLNGYLVGGRQTVAQTWRAGDLPFIVAGRLELAETAAVLVLQPGLTVKLQQKATIEAVRGLLRSGQTGAEPVLLTSIADDACSATVPTGCDTNGDGALREPAPGDWGAVVIRGGGGFIRRTVMRYGGDASSSSALDLQSTENTAVEDSEFLFSSGAGIRVFQISSTLTRNKMEENRGAGVKLVAGGTPVVVTLDSNEFVRNVGCAVDMDANVELVLEGNNDAVANGRNGLCVCGDSRVSRTWKKGTLPYLVTSDVRIVGQSLLTIEPGAVIKLIGQAAIVVTDKSALKAEGTLAEPITFTSLNDDTYGGDSNPNDGPAEPNAGDWKGIRFESSASGTVPSVLAHARVLYTGNLSQPAVFVALPAVRMEHLEVRDGSAVGVHVENVDASIVGNAFTNMRGAAIEIRTRADALRPVIERNTIRGCAVAAAIDANVEPQLDGNVAENNLLNGITVKGAMTVERTWQADDLPFLLEDRVTISRGGNLRIESGTLIKALQNAVLTVDYGALEIPKADTGERRVTITSVRDDTCGEGTDPCDTNNDGATTIPRPGDWEGITVLSTAREATIHRGDVLYGGSRAANIVIEKDLVDIRSSSAGHSATNGLNIDDARVSVTDSLFVGNRANGLELLSGASVTLDGNVFTDNGRSVEHRATGTTTTRNNVAIGNTEDAMLYCAPVSTTQTWTADLPRDVDCLVKVSAATLTLDPGLVLRFAERTGMDVTSELRAEGVTFTAIDQSGDYGLWRGLRFESNSRGGWVRHSRFLYAGYGGQGTVDSLSQGALDVSFNVFRRIDTIGVSARKQSPMTIMGNLFRDLSGDRGGAVRAEDAGTNPKVHNNRMASAGTGVAANVDAQPEIRGNSFADSSSGVINRDPTVCVDAKQNWWASIAGPTDRSIAGNDACGLRDNAGGNGVTASDHVDYTDWLRQAPPMLPQVAGPRCGVTSSSSQEAYGETSPRATVNVYDGAAANPGVPIATTEADDRGEFRLDLTLGTGMHKLSFEAVKDGARSPVSGFRMIEVVPDSPVDPMGIRFEHGTGATLRAQPLRDEAGCATGCGGLSSGRVTLPPGEPVRVFAPVAGSPTKVEFVQAGRAPEPMEYDGVTRAYATEPFEPVQGAFTIRVEGAQSTECMGFVYLGAQGIVFADVGASGEPPRTPAGEPFDFDFESGQGGWNASSPWAIVASNAHSPTHSWHDSPDGNYPARSELELRGPGPLDLRTVSSPELRFWSVYRFARGDRGTVEIRTRETGTWTILRQFRETIGAWRGEVISLENYAGEPTVWIRFVTSSDATYEDDGWYIDDVSINPGGALNGRYDDGEPLVSGAQVLLEQHNLDTGEWRRWDPAPTGQVNAQTSDAHGRYGFYYLEPGEYEVVVTAPAGSGVFRSPPQIVWDGTFAFEAPLRPTQPTYLPVTLKRRFLGD